MISSICDNLCPTIRQLYPVLTYKKSLFNYLITLLNYMLITLYNTVFILSLGLLEGLAVIVDTAILVGERFRRDFFL